MTRGERLRADSVTAGVHSGAPTRIVPVIPRYSRPAMSRVWSEEAKLETWLAVELAVLDAWAEVGRVPRASARALRDRARVPSPQRVAELERKTNHDVAAFVDAVASELGEDGRWFHYGLTSSDVLDTALALTVQAAGDLVRAGIEKALHAVDARAAEHRDTVTIGRTHGIHAEPTTFGLKLVGWAFELERDRDRLEHALAGMRVGKLSGAVGTYATTTPEVERHRLRGPRARAGAELDADPPARPPRRAALRACRARLVTRPLRARDQAPRANRGARGRGAVCLPARRARRRCRTNATRSSPSGSAVSHGSCAATPSSGSRTSRCGTSATSRTRQRSASCSPTPSWPSTTCSTVSRGSSKVSSFVPSACARISRRRAACTSASGCCLRSSSRGSSATPRTASSSARRCGPGTRGSTSAALVRGDAEIAARVDLDAVFDLTSLTRHVDDVFARRSPQAVPEEATA